MANKTVKILWALDPFNTDPSIIKKCVTALKGFSPIPVEPVYVASPAEVNLNLEFSVPAKQRYQKVSQAALQKILRSTRFPQLRAPKVLMEDHLTISAGAKALAAYASKEKALMIMVGTHAKKGIDRAILGSFAETLLSYSKVPVVLINPRSKPSQSIKKILFATDFSPNSRSALARLLPLARILGAKLLIHHVLSKPSEAILWSGSIPMREGLVPMLDFLRTEAQRRTTAGHRFTGLAAKAKVPAEFLIENSAKKVDQAIMNRADAIGASLIAMASQSGRFSAFLLGSASRGVLREADKPVWIFRP